MPNFFEILKQRNIVGGAVGDLIESFKRSIETQREPSTKKEGGFDLKTTGNFFKDIQTSFQRRQDIGAERVFPKPTPEQLAESKRKSEVLTSGLLGATKELGKEVLRATPRAAGSVALDITKQGEFIPETKAERFLFGERKLEPTTKQIERFPERAEEFGIPEKVGKPLAVPLVVGATLLDVFPITAGKKDVVKKIVEETSPKIIKGLLKKTIKSDVADDVLDFASKVLAKTDDIDDIEEVLSRIQVRPPNISRVATKQDFDKAIERGFITSTKEVVPELKIQGQYIPRSTDELSIKAKNLIADDVKLAEQVAISQTDDVGVATASELIKHLSRQADEVVDVASKNAIHEKIAQISSEVARSLTEQGRSVQAASILGKMTPEGQVRFAAREIQKHNQDILRGVKKGKQLPELTAEQSKEILEEMKEINKMSDGLEKAMRFQKLQNKIKDLVPNTLADKLMVLWKAGLLTGIKTSGLNLFSNISHFGSEIAKDIPATIIDNIASLFTGKRTKTFTTKGVPRGLKEGVDNGWRYLKTGFDERNVGAKLDYKRVNFGESKVAKGLQKYEETVFRILGSADQPFYYGAKARSLYDQAFAIGKNKGLKGEELKNFANKLVQNPTDEMVKIAVADAETAVYQNRTFLGDMARHLQKSKLGEFLVPFGRTPSAVAMQIINYSPIGVVRAFTENIGRGRFNQRQFSEMLSRGLTGTAVLFLGSEMFKKGLISLDFPTSEKERELWKLEGKKPNAIKVDGKWRSPIVLGPAGNLLLIGGHFAQSFKEEGSPTAAISKAMFGSAKSFKEQTFLTGIERSTKALENKNLAEGYIGSSLASTIPTLVSDIARATDPKERRQEGISERIIARVPGARRTLEPRVDVLGKEQERVGSFIETLIDPTRPSRIYSSPVINEIKRMWDAGFRVSPTLLGDKRGYDSLTQKQNTELWKKAGEITNDKLGSLFQNEEYKNAPEDIKAKTIENFINKAKLYSRVALVIHLLDGLEGEGLQKELSKHKESGLINREVFDLVAKMR
jgi:hypothetical protein